MQIQITGKNIDVGDAMRQHVKQRLESDVAKYFDGIVNAHVTINKESSAFRCECNLNLSTGLSLQSEGRSEEAYSAFNKASERLEKRLRRYKRRIKHHHARSTAKAVAALNAQAYILAQESKTEPEPEDLNRPIIAESLERIPDISVGEAVMQLDISDAPVVVFRNTDHGRLNVIYRRADGNIGWIDPKQADSTETTV